MTEREKFEIWFNKEHWNPLASPEDGEGNCDGFFNDYDVDINEYKEEITQAMWFAWESCADKKDKEIAFLRYLISKYEID